MVNEWTADDLPVAFEDSKRPGQYWNPSSDMMRDLVVWLNAHHPKPPRGDAALADHLGRQAEAIDELQLDLEAAERDRARWRRAHEIGERERDQARDERDKWEEKYLDTDEALHRARASLHEACKVAQSYKVDAYQATERAEAAERERDETDFDLFTVRDQLKQCRGERERMTRERDEWKARAEAAEARTAPAVTKRELRGVVGAHDPGDDELAVSRVNALTDRLWSLVSGADPAVFVVRESDLPEAWRDRDGLWRAGQSSYCRVTPEDMRSVIPATLGMVAARESVARAIEAEEAEAVDPVEELAGQIESATRDAIRQVCDTFATVAPTLDPLAVEQAMEVTAASRKIAAHVLGQEVK